MIRILQINEQKSENTQGFESQKQANMVSYIARTGATAKKKNVARTGAIAREKQTLTIRNWWTGYTQWSSSVIRLNKYHASRQHGKHICTMSHNLGEISGLRYPIWVAQISVLLHEHETPRFKAKNLRSRHSENQTVCISLKRCCPSQRSVYIRRESIGRSSSPKDKIVHIEKRSMFSH